ncbi:MAG: flotillin family protein [Lachnospiraceae bacterium]|nr:flotillin family protein [Lachnospiraceae bacterium]
MSTEEALLVLGIVIAVILLLIIVGMGYVKAPTDQAVIISGLKKEPKFIIGRSSVRIPFLQRLDRLSLKMLSIDVRTSKTIPTLDYINIMVDSVAIVKIGTSNQLIKAAAENFLNKDSGYINQMVVNVLEGNLREIIGAMRLVDIMNDRKTFAAMVQENAALDMAKMGLEIVSFNIQNIDDAGLGVIENLGIANTVAIRQSAEISRANAEKEIAVAQASARKEANEAQIEAETQIAQKNNELDIRKSELKVAADIKRAEADAAYEIQKQEQAKTIETQTVNVQIAKAEREAELKQKEVLVRQQELSAQIERQADAEKYKAEKDAEAKLAQRQRQAEAEKYEQEKSAEAQKAKADAARYAAEQEAAGITAKGMAEAEAIKAKGLAEAEAMEKKAEAYKKYNGAAVIEMMVNILPQMAAEVAKPLSAIDKVNIYGSGGTDGSGVQAVSGNMPVVMKQVFDTMTEATGVDFTEIMKASTYDAKVTKNINVTGLEGAAAPEAAKAVTAAVPVAAASAATAGNDAE